MNQDELIEEYKKVHTDKLYPRVLGGHSILKYKEEFIDFCKIHKPNTILDYGCGKGYQYTEDNLHILAGIEMPTLYDPGIEGFSKKPVGSYDSVICTDVMEHIHQDECDNVLDDIFHYAKDSIFFSISCNLAIKHFKDGTNFHVNCKPEEWWFATIKRLKPPHLKVWLMFTSFKGIIKYDQEELYEEYN